MAYLIYNLSAKRQLDDDIKQFVSVSGVGSFSDPCEKTAYELARTTANLNSIDASTWNHQTGLENVTSNSIRISPLDLGTMRYSITATFLSKDTTLSDTPKYLQGNIDYAIGDYTNTSLAVLELAHRITNFTFTNNKLKETIYPINVNILCYWS